MTRTITCDVLGVEFDIQQDGPSFSGAQVGSGTMTCTTAGMAENSATVINEIIVGGVVTGNGVEFELGSAPGLHHGDVAAGSMTGSATWEINGSTLTGEFNAARVSP